MAAPQQVSVGMQVVKGIGEGIVDSAVSFYQSLKASPIEMSTHLIMSYLSAQQYIESMKSGLRTFGQHVVRDIRHPSNLAADLKTSVSSMESLVADAKQAWHTSSAETIARRTTSGAISLAALFALPEAAAVVMRGRLFAEAASVLLALIHI